jgi:hypothetical protein
MKIQLAENGRITRRQWVTKVAAAAAGAALSNLAIGQPSGSEIVSVEEQSDFDDPVEKLTFNLTQAEAPLKITSKGPQKAAQAFAARMLAISKEYAGAGVCRSNARPQITQFLQLFGLPFEENGVPTRYCATGVSFAACRAYCEIQPEQAYRKDNPVAVFETVLTDVNKYYFKPSPAVWIIRDNAVERGTWVNQGTVDPKSGWLVIFSFRKDRFPSHVGIVSGPSNNSIDTVEFNTTPQVAGSNSNGGCVSQKNRQFARGGILGYVKTY